MMQKGIYAIATVPQSSLTTASGSNEVPLLIFTVVQTALAAMYNNFPYTRWPKGGINRIFTDFYSQHLV